MFNPLQAFEERFIRLFQQKGVKAFVKQTYKRGRPDFNEKNTEAFVLIHFQSLVAAQQYFDVLKEDPGRELLKPETPEDTEKIRHLLHTSKVFTMLKVKEAESKARKLLDKKIRAFIEYKLHWRPGSQDEVRFGLDVQFGEVYAKLTFRSQEIKVKLEEIENPHYVL